MTRPFFGYQVPLFTVPGVPDDQLFEHLVTLVQAAEKAGFDMVTVMDHFYQIRGLGPEAHAPHGGALRRHRQLVRVPRGAQAQERGPAGPLRSRRPGPVDDPPHGHGSAHPGGRPARCGPLLAHLPPERRASLLPATPATAAEVLAPYREAGFDGFILRNPMLSTVESIALAGEMIAAMQ